MRPSWGRAIRAARRAAGLTQKQLGARLGRTGHAVQRWELDQARPPRSKRLALVKELGALNPAAGAALAAALASMPTSRGGPGRPLVPPAPPMPVIDVPREVERALFAFADELDVPARRARAALVKLHRRLREAKVDLGQAEARLEEWVQADVAPSE